MLKRYAIDKRGASALEFAIIAPVFLLFLLGIFYTAWAIYSITTARFAVDEIARSLQMNQKLTAADLDIKFKQKITMGLMTVKSLTLEISASQPGFSIARINVPIHLTLQIPYMTEIRIDCSASTQVALIAL